MLRLRIDAHGPMLSPGGRAWCRLDARRGANGLGDTVARAPQTVVLTGAHAAQVDGLLDWRHGAPLSLYATPLVFEQLTQGLPVLPLLAQCCGVRWHPIRVSGDAREAPFTIEAWPSLGFDARAIDESHIALRVRDRDQGRSLAYCPVQAPDEATLAWIDGVDCLLFGGEAPAERRRRASWLRTFDGLRARHKLLLADLGPMELRL